MENQKRDKGGEVENKNLDRFDVILVRWIIHHKLYNNKIAAQYQINNHSCQISQKQSNLIILIKTFLMKSSKSQQKTNSLTEQFIYSILGQEQTYKKQRNKANLTKLIELYRKLVQYYSEKNDKINIYFMDKIAQLSSEIPLLQQPEEKLTKSMARQVAEEDSSIMDSRFKNIATTSSVKYDPEQKKKERSKNAQIAIEVNKVKKRTNARTILKSYYQQCLQNNNLVNADLQMQRKQLQQKLMAIHKKSMEVGNRKIII